MLQRFGFASLACAALLACSGDVGHSGGNRGTGATSVLPPGASAASGTGSPSASGTGGSSGGTAGNYAPGEEPADPLLEFQPASVRSYLRKVKNLLVGLPPTDEEVAAVEQAGDAQAALAALIDGWISPDSGQSYDMFRQKMIVFFTNAFQQSGFTPTEDFKPQLLENGGFDLGPLGVYGDDAFPKLVQNLQESFARTAWEIAAAGRPFTQVLTTQEFMLTPALMSLYIQIEMPNDQPFNFSFGMMQPEKLAWRVEMSGTDIALEQTLDPNSPNYLVFDDEPPLTPVGFELDPTCHGNAQTNMYSGYAQLFQRLIGFTPRYPFAAQPECWEHASLPYFTSEDLSAWKLVKLRPLASGEARIEPFDLPALRSATELGLALPRVGFYTTPAYLALWNTNDSNQHRVTANQTLLVALGQSFTSEAAIVPVSTVGLDPEHAVETSICYGCHKSLDPLRQFWANEYDFNDRNDFPARVFGGISNPRPSSRGGVLAFGNVNGQGASITELGPLLSQVTDVADGMEVNRFALAMAQKLCFYADSASCAETDPEFRRVALAFQNANYDFMTLVRELMSSPLVTVAAHTQTFDERNPLVSVSRRDQLCQQLSIRLGKPDICALSVAFPFARGFGGMGDPLAAQRAIYRLAGSLPADAFSRGSENQVTPPEPTLFYRAASEMVCESVAGMAVDGDIGRYSSGDPEGAMADMVSTLMGYPSSDPHAAEALQILRDNYAEALASNVPQADALRSTFALACQSPTSLSFGL